MRAPAATAIAALSLAGCWKDDYQTLDGGDLEFQPQVDAPAGWVVKPFDSLLECPDGEPARYYFLHPEEVPAQPMRAAVLYHGGAFDYVFAPNAQDPLAGTHFAQPERLSREYAVHQVFATLGMYPEPDPDHLDEGLVASLLAQRDVAVMMPTNCWGDLWASKVGGADNVFVEDYFLRQGRSAAEWSFRMLVDETFALGFEVDLPVDIDTEHVYAIGLSEGGRAVAEVLSVDNDEDGTPDFHVEAALVDSPPDDLSVYLDDPGLHASVVEGLNRIFPGGEPDTRSGSMAFAPLPTRVGYVYSSADTEWPAEVHRAAVDRITAEGGFVRETERAANGLLNGGDVGLATDAIDYLLGN